MRMTLQRLIGRTDFAKVCDELIAVYDLKGSDLVLYQKAYSILQSAECEPQSADVKIGIVWMDSDITILREFPTGADLAITGYFAFFVLKGVHGTDIVANNAFACTEWVHIASESWASLLGCQVHERSLNRRCIECQEIAERKKNDSGDWGD